MLAPNWEDHDASTNPIINYFADRPHTGKVLKDIVKKKLTPRVVFTVKYVKTAQNLKPTGMNSINKVFGSSTKK